MMECRCGHVIENDEFDYCPKCGEKLPEAEPEYEDDAEENGEEGVAVDERIQKLEKQNQWLVLGLVVAWAALLIMGVQVQSNFSGLEQVEVKAEQIEYKVEPIERYGDGMVVLSTPIFGVINPDYEDSGGVYINTEDKHIGLEDAGGMPLFAMYKTEDSTVMDVHGPGGDARIRQSIMKDDGWLNMGIFASSDVETDASVFRLLWREEYGSGILLYDRHAEEFESFHGPVAP